MLRIVMGVVLLFLACARPKVAAAHMDLLAGVEEPAELQRVLERVGHRSSKKAERLA
jgi:hypothetical protein